jgi:hypothetical protein
MFYLVLSGSLASSDETLMLLQEEMEIQSNVEKNLRRRSTRQKIV